MQNFSKVSIYGLGNFGYAILKHLDSKNEKKIQITCFDRNRNLISNLQTHKNHLFLHKSIKISNRVKFTSNIKSLVQDCDILILATPSKSLREVLRKIKPYINRRIILINTAKALDYKTGKRLSEIVKEEWKGTQYDYALIAGGTIAKDLFNSEPLGIDAACENKVVLPMISNLFSNSNLVVYTTTDLKGVEYASSLKNVISILAGIIKGMDFSFGSETYIITRVSSEIEKIILNVFGGKKRTLENNSQCWTNDLWMSSLGPTRNREFGVLLGKGIPVKTAISIMDKQGKTIEGLSTLKSLKHVPELKRYPLTNFLYRFIILESKSLEEIKQVILRGNF